ncbi:MAG: 16S rRNA (cytidine(1402)-2'-O)-methyltransferase [Bacilli bacterium]|jgi:16S rRNA (cytidine1402-2'-O)-methyltransferase
MIIQKSNLNDKQTLYIVATPIGNLNDMTYRGVMILKEVSFIFAEDTRVTKGLLSHFNISTPLISCHEYNEEERISLIKEKLRSNLNVALVSDAGMPLISDPGYKIVKAVLDEGFNVVSLPGANAFLTALVASGLSTDKFLFYGFLDHKNTKKEKELTSLVDYKETLIFYESPLRLKDTLILIKKVMGNRSVVVARELTKKYEEYIRGSVSEVLDVLDNIKGEIVLLVEGAKEDSILKELNDKSIIEHYEFYLLQNLETMDAMKKVAKDRGISKSEVYAMVKKKN